MKGCERGSATLEAAIVYPVVLLFILLAVNTALWFHARNTAMAAAQEGVRIGRAYGSTPAAGQEAARRFIQKVGGSFLRSATVTVDWSGDTLAVTVHGEAISLIPPFGVGVEQVARAPVERWTVE